jgi:hypothetical protein
VCPAASFTDVFFAAGLKICSTIEKVFLPDNLITAIAPKPGGVAKAQMVSLLFMLAKNVSVDMVLNFIQIYSHLTKKVSYLI